MAVIYVCRKCGEEILTFDKVGQDYYGIRTPDEIKSMYGGRCPRCGNPFKVPDVEDVTISRRKKARSFYF